MKRILCLLGYHEWCSVLFHDAGVDYDQYKICNQCEKKVSTTGGIKA